MPRTTKRLPLLLFAIPVITIIYLFLTPSSNSNSPRSSLSNTAGEFQQRLVEKIGWERAGGRDRKFDEPDRDEADDAELVQQGPPAHLWGGLGGGFDSKHKPPSRGGKKSSSSSSSKKSSKSPSAGLTPNPNHHGLFTLPLPLRPSTEHPITTLIRKGRETQIAHQKKIRSIRTLEDAVADYREMTGGTWDPPRGFEIWFDFVQQHESVPCPSLIPQAHLSVLPFLAFPAPLLRERLENRAKDDDALWFYEILGGKKGVEGGGKYKGQYRYNFTPASDVLKVIQPILPLLPARIPSEPPVRIYFAAHDGPSAIADWEVVEGSRKRAREHRVWESSRLEKLERESRGTAGWVLNCQPGTAYKKSAKDLILEGEDEDVGKSAPEKTFIQDPVASYDYCHNPELMKIHGTLINDASRDAKLMMPVISYCKTLHNIDIMGVPMDAIYQSVDPIPWADKSVPKLHWRGSLTGAFHNSWTDWRSSQRERMSYLVANKGEQKDVLVERVKEGGKKTLELEAFDVEEMNEKWFDIGPTGGASQCDPGECEILQEEFKWAGRISPQEGIRYKYVLDMDGNGWSSRLRRLLTSSTVVVKSTVFPEWNSEIMIPWFHYVPLKVDYTDIYDIMAYFVGAPDDGTGAHDKEAKAIAWQGANFVEDHWRLVDVQSYMLLLMLEYTRAVSDDREAATWHAGDE